MTVVRVLTAFVLLIAAGCESEDKAALKNTRYWLDVELTQKRNLARDVKAARSELLRLQRVTSGLDTDYSDGALIAAMDAGPRVTVTKVGETTERTPLVLVHRVKISAPHSLEPELKRLQASTFPAFELDRIEWNEREMTVEVIVPQPNAAAPVSAEEFPSPLLTPNGHWWDGSQEVRAECDDFSRQISDVDAELADAGALSLRDDLALAKKRAELLLKADKYLRAEQRYVPPELPLMMQGLSEGKWSRDARKAIGSAKGTEDALRDLTALQPSAAKDGDAVRWSAELP